MTTLSIVRLNIEHKYKQIDTISMPARAFRFVIQFSVFAFKIINNWIIVNETNENIHLNNWFETTTPQWVCQLNYVSIKDVQHVVFVFVKKRDKNQIFNVNNIPKTLEWKTFRIGGRVFFFCSSLIILLNHSKPLK